MLGWPYTLLVEECIYLERKNWFFNLSSLKNFDSFEVAISGPKQGYLVEITCNRIHKRKRKRKRKSEWHLIGRKYN